MVKGTADIQVMQSRAEESRRRHRHRPENQEPVAGRVSLLKVDEYWYDKKMQTGHRRPAGLPQAVHAGEVIEITMKSPVKPDLYKNQFKFSHANGEVNAKAVKKFD